MSLEVFNKNIGKIKLIPLNYRSEKDYEIFKDILCDINIMKTSSVFDGKITDDEEAIKKYFVIMNKSNSTHKIGFYKLISDCNDFIGIAGFVLIEQNKNLSIKTLEIGYLLKNKYHSKKIGYDIAKFLINFAFNTFETTEKILGTALIENIPSQIIMLKCGLKYLGKKLKRNSIINYFSINREEFNIKNTTIKSSEFYKKYILELNKKNSIEEKIDEFIV